MASITSLGIGSGIDLASLLDKFVAAERAPADARLNSREAKLQARFSSFGTLKSTLSDIQSKASTLGTLSETRSASVSDSSVFTATAASDAGVGQFNIVITALAQTQSLASSAFTASTDVVGTGTLTITLADASSVQVVIDASNNTVAGVRDAINAANGGVNAAIVTDTSGARLTFNSAATGTATAVSSVVISGDGDGNDSDNAGLSQLSFSVAAGPPSFLNETQPAGDAVLTVNGLAVTSNSNILTDVIQGVTLTLKKTTGASAETLTVARDTSNVATAVSSFISAFNNFADFIDQNASFNSDTGVAGLLLGDSTLSSVQAGVGNAFFASFTTTDTTIRSLSDIGVSLGSDGKLSLDSSKLDAALSANSAATFSLLNQAGSNFESITKAFTDTTGIIETRIDGLQTRIDDISTERDKLDQRIASFQARLQKQFAALDQLISQLKTQGDFLLGQLANVPVPGQSKK